MDYYDLAESFEKPGCAICRLALHGVDRYLESLLYESVVDARSFHAVRTRRGLCGEHSIQMLEYKGQSLGIGILYQAALDEVLTILDSAPDSIQSRGLLDGLMKDKRQRSALIARLEPAEPCVACNILQDTEGRWLDALGQHIGITQVRDAFQASDGLCLPHFIMAIQAITETNALRQVIEIQRSIWERLKRDLDAFIDKSSTQQHAHMTDKENTSWRRAARVNGERGVFGPDPRPPRR
jgi:hypothetical protein